VVKVSVNIFPEVRKRIKEKGSEGSEEINKISTERTHCNLFTH
jgi:hypothetical protein